jgi:glycopeptide antibiotics resistance protein
MRWFCMLLLALYLVLVTRLTLADPSAGRWAFSFADHVATRVSDGRLVWSQTEVLANVALFVPLGFLLTLITCRPLLSAVLCLLGSAGIELAQAEWLVTRVASIADVQHNAFGGLLGVVVAWLFLRLFKHRKQPMVAQ